MILKMQLATGVAQKAEDLRSASILLFAAAGVAFLIAVILWVKLDVAHAVSILTGIGARRGVSRLKKEGMAKEQKAGKGKNVNKNVRSRMSITKKTKKTRDAHVTLNDETEILRENF